jgi:predicted CXXCH cytochrome family protein
MGRSFYRPARDNTIEDYTRNNTYYHQASNQYFRMYQHDDRYFARRHQIGPDGQETNVVEKEIHYILGSGNHSRTYLHKTPNGQLVELPLAWYSENGGMWAMNPGYDRPDHMDFRRKIDKECFSCHNAYAASESDSDTPELFLPGTVPEGIDCQRCHGPGAAHVRSARKGETITIVRKAIVNPARLSRERQLELCFRCHLKSTNRPLPYAVRRFDQGYFYRPGGPLENYVLHFDRAPAFGFDDRFEIAHSAYRLLKSACFSKSNGALLCTSCHNPHQVLRGPEAVQHYVQVCLSCHQGRLDGLVAAGKHMQLHDCLGCHMPKRRTDDVVHAVMTDHYIQRNKPARDLLAPVPEAQETEKTAYKGEVVLLYPPRLVHNGRDQLYLAVAQVAEGANLKAGIPQLQKAIDVYRPREAEFYFFLADAYRQTGRDDRATAYYEEALRRRPDFLPARLNYATVLIKMGRRSAAARALEIAVKVAPKDPAVLNKLAETYRDLGKTDQAIASLQRALNHDPDFAEAFVNLGDVRFGKGDLKAAVEALTNAIRLRPGSATAHNNLANVLQAAGDFAQAEYHFNTSIGLDPENPAVRYNYGRALAAQGMLKQGQAEFEAALRLDPNFAEAATSLGILLAMKGEVEPAIELYRRAIRVQPQFMSARFHLGLALLRRGDRQEAKQLFQSVVQSNSNDHEAQLQLGKILLSEGSYDGAALCLQKAAESSQPALRTGALELLRAAKEKRIPSIPIF